MKADATAEKRPAYFIISGSNGIPARGTHKYQGSIEVIVVLFLKISIVVVRLLSEPLVEACARVWLLLRESRFDHGDQIIVPPMTNVKKVHGEGWYVCHTSVARSHPSSGSSYEDYSPRLIFDQVSALRVFLCWPSTVD